MSKSGGVRGSSKQIETVSETDHGDKVESKNTPPPPHHPHHPHHSHHPHHEIHKLDESAGNLPLTSDIDW